MNHSIPHGSQIIQSTEDNERQNNGGVKTIRKHRGLLSDAYNDKGDTFNSEKNKNEVELES